MTRRDFSAQELVDLPQDAPVVVTSAYGSFEEGDTIYRLHNEEDDVRSCLFASEPEGKGQTNWMNRTEVERPEQAAPVVDGVYRPDVTTRKAGKIRVELVDDGFPLALREVAKVMTWAQTAKGYKDHDWQNLPSAEIQLAAAASRHRTDYIMQRLIENLPPAECVDHESKIVHKAHEAFGVLAQLELLLRGKFDE